MSNLSGLLSPVISDPLTHSRPRLAGKGILGYPTCLGRLRSRMPVNILPFVFIGESVGIVLVLSVAKVNAAVEMHQLGARWQGPFAEAPDMFIRNKLEALVARGDVQSVF